jgi:polyhydroxyalkanoate synthesis regulator phasin
MNNELEIFKPGIAELKSMAEQFKGLTINGVGDEAGYQTVKEARKKLGDMRILITKTGKSAREEARRYASSVIEQEKEYLGVITPTEESLKAKIEAIDDEKKRAERIILLPSRKAMLAEMFEEVIP